MELSGVMIGSEDPKRLVEYYSKVLGAPEWTEDEFAGWNLGNGWLTVYAHDQVKGSNASSGRIMWIMDSSDVEGDFARLKGNGATVVAEPYHPSDEESMTVATFSDPDDNYFQLMSPMSEPEK